MNLDDAARAANAFLPPTPCCWSISGGRTSGLMLRRRMDHGPARDGEHFLFANTGKERPETLDFLHEIETRWGVPLVWIERTGGGGFRDVNYASASRNGEPFLELIRERDYLPNVIASRRSRRRPRCCPASTTHATTSTSARVQIDTHATT